MSVKLLEHIRNELISSGAAANTPEFCRAWLGRSEGYIRTLRNHGTGPSVETLYATSPPHWDFACRRGFRRILLTFLPS
jgi:hypothetical protein